MTSPLLLTLVLTAAPCVRVVVTPFEPLATSPAVARALEEQVRGALTSRPGLCVEPRAATIASGSRVTGTSSFIGAVTL